MGSQVDVGGIMRRYVEFVLRHPWWVIAALILTTLFLGSRLMSLKIDMDQDTWIPQSHPYVQTTKVLEKVFGGRDVVVIGIVPRSGDVYQERILSKVQRIQDGIEQIPNAIRHNIFSLAARKVKDIRGVPDGMIARPMMEAVPRTSQEIDALRQRVARNPIYVGSLVSPDGRAAAVIADFKVDTSKPSYAALYEAVRAVVDKERDDAVDIYLGGLPIQFAWFENYMMQMPLYFGAALLIIVLIQYWSFRSFQGMLLPIATALLSVIWALGFMGLVDVHMDGMNTTTPILILAVAAGHAIQILKRYYEEYHRLQRDGVVAVHAIHHRAIVDSLSRVGPVMIMAGLIASVTFYSLTLSEVSAVRHFGMFAGSGTLAAMILEMTLIPAVRSVLHPPRSRELRGEQRTGVLDRGLDWLGRQLNDRPTRVLFISVATLVGVVAGVTMLDADNSLKRYNRAGSEVRVHDDAINERFGGTNSIFFLVDGGRPDAIKEPAVLRGMVELQTFLTGQPDVGKTQSIADVIRRMNQALHADAPRYDAIPDDRALIAQYLFLYSLSGEPQDFTSLVDNDYSKAAIWVFLKTDSTAYAETLNRKARELIARSFPPDVSVRIGGSLAQTIAGNDELTRGKFLNIVQMAVAVLVLGSIALRSFTGGVFVVAPLLLVTAANFGIMGWLGIPLDMGTATTAAMAIGIGADYELYLLFRFREELARTGDMRLATTNALRSSGKAIVLVALSIAIGYAVLLLSGFGFYTRLSIMVISTMVVSALVALVFLRAVAVLFRPKFIFGESGAAVPVRAA